MAATTLLSIRRPCETSTFLTVIQKYLILVIIKDLSCCTDLKLIVPFFYEKHMLMDDLFICWHQARIVSKNILRGFYVHYQCWQLTGNEYTSHPSQHIPEAVIPNPRLRAALERVRDPTCYRACLLWDAAAGRVTALLCVHLDI
jgi:hypothetical protein